MPNKRQSTNKIIVKKRAVALKKNPQVNSFANITFVLKSKPEQELEPNEFQFILASAIQEIHGEIANHVDILSFKSIDKSNYSSIIRFKTIHFTRIITSLILFGQWKETDCKFEINKTAQSLCFLTV